MSAAIRRRMTLAAATKRTPKPTGTPAVSGAPTVHISSLRCTPLYPVTTETALRVGIETPHGVFQVFVGGEHDIEPGDRFILDGKEWPIRRVDPWDDGRGGMFKNLYIEDLRR